jgi:hypothetical protein
MNETVVPGLGVSARLQPAPQLGVMDQYNPPKPFVDHEGTGGEMCARLMPRERMLERRCEQLHLLETRRFAGVFRDMRCKDFRQ